MSSGGRGDIFGRAMGMLVFLLGICLLVVVFRYAFMLFGQDPAQALDLHFTGDPKRDPLLSVIGFKFGWILVRIGILITMSIAGSFISQRGINLYFSAMQGAPVSPRPAIAPAVHSDARGETS